VTKCDLRCFVALAGILPARRYVLTCRSNTRVPVLLPRVPVPLLVGLTASIIEQCDGWVLRNVGLQESLFDPPPSGEKDATAKDDGAAAPFGVAGGSPKL
jgi:hypothetical protein